jgi:hypothetical protein
METLDVASTYVRRVPAEIRTPMRQALNIRWPDPIDTKKPI